MCACAPASDNNTVPVKAGLRQDKEKAKQEDRREDRRTRFPRPRPCLPLQALRWVMGLPMSR